MQLYPALIARTKNNLYHAWMYGFDGLEEQGNTEAEAIIAIRDAFRGAIISLYESEDTPPNPSSTDEVKGFAKQMGFEDYSIVYLEAPGPDIPPVRVTITIGPGLLARIDQAAKREGMSRSGFLANGARCLLAELKRIDEE